MTSATALGETGPVVDFKPLGGVLAGMEELLGAGVGQKGLALGGRVGVFLLEPGELGMAGVRVGGLHELLG